MIFDYENMVKYKNEWMARGYEVPSYDMKQVGVSTYHNPTWIHFGAGNLFRAFPAAILNQLLNNNQYNKGVIVCATYDLEALEKAYSRYNNLSALFILKEDKTFEKKVIGSITEGIKADLSDEKEFSRLKAIFSNPSLQMATFMITEKGYKLRGRDGQLLDIIRTDIECRDLRPKHVLGICASVLYERFLACEAPIALVSMDNCANNGDRLREGILLYVNEWEKRGIVGSGFKDYILSSKVAFPLSMIDKITPRPNDMMRNIMCEDGFENIDICVTEKRTYIAPFVNAEETGYLVIEDDFPNGRPPLEKGGVIFTSRESVKATEKMKVSTCLNPLHTALAIWGTILGYHTIAETMQDALLNGFVVKMVYQEGLPVVENSGAIDPEEFLNTVLKKRFVNEFLPDTLAGVATDTSQKLAVRFGETLKEYVKNGRIKELKYIPMVLAGYIRYLIALDDKGEVIELSDDPLLDEFTLLVKPLREMCLNNMETPYVYPKETKEKQMAVVHSAVKQILSYREVFLIDLYENGLGEAIEEYTYMLIQNKGAVRHTLMKACE